MTGRIKRISRSSRKGVKRRSRSSRKGGKSMRYRGGRLNQKTLKTRRKTSMTQLKKSRSQRTLIGGSDTQLEAITSPPKFDDVIIETHPNKYFGLDSVNGDQNLLGQFRRIGGIDTSYTHVVAFDFDQCLMNGHWWSTLQNLTISQLDFAETILFDSNQKFGLERETLKELFNTLNRAHHVLIAIASFGRRDVIYSVLNALGIIIDNKPNYASNIYITTPGDFSTRNQQFTDGMDIGDKNHQLLKIAKDVFGNTDAETLKKIIFFDDSQHNINEAHKLGVTVSKDANGLPKTSMPIDQSSIDDIMEHIKSP